MAGTFVSQAWKKNWGSGEKPVKPGRTPVSPDTEVAILTGADSGYPTTARRKPDSPWGGRRSSGPGSKPRTSEERLDAIWLLLETSTN